MKQWAKENYIGIKESDIEAVCRFRDRINVCDLIAMETKEVSMVAVGEVTGEYKYDPNLPNYRHRREVEWVNVPKGEIDDDLLISIESRGTVHEVKGLEADTRLREVLAALQPHAPENAKTDPDSRWDAFIAWAKLFTNGNCSMSRNGTTNWPRVRISPASKKPFWHGNPTGKSRCVGPCGIATQATCWIGDLPTLF